MLWTGHLPQAILQGAAAIEAVEAPRLANANSDPTVSPLAKGIPNIDRLVLFLTTP